MSRGPISTGKRVVSPPFDHGPLKAAVSRKAHKHYAPPVHLCVYVTYGGKSIVSDEVVRSVAEAGGDEFESVWIVTHEYMMCAKRWDPIGDVGRWVPIPIKPLREEQ